MDGQEARKKARGPDPPGEGGGKEAQARRGERGEEGWREGAAGTPRRHRLALAAA